MAAVVGAVEPRLDLAAASKLAAMAWLAVEVGLGVAVYVGMLALLRSPELGVVRRAFSRN